jgi:hypothetical protein
MYPLSHGKEETMEKITDTTEYEAPRIEDHGDLTELTAAGSIGKYADATIYSGEEIAGHLQSSP